jgi:hypothetical protein
VKRRKSKRSYTFYGDGHKEFTFAKRILKRMIGKPWQKVLKALKNNLPHNTPESFYEVLFKKHAVTLDNLVLVSEGKTLIIGYSQHGIFHPFTGPFVHPETYTLELQYRKRSRLDLSRTFVIEWEDEVPDDPNSFPHVYYRNPTTMDLVEDWQEYETMTVDQSGYCYDRYDKKFRYLSIWRNQIRYTAEVEWRSKVADSFAKRLDEKVQEHVYEHYYEQSKPIKNNETIEKYRFIPLLHNTPRNATVGRVRR